MNAVALTRSRARHNRSHRLQKAASLVAFGFFVLLALPSAAAAIPSFENATTVSSNNVTNITLTVPSNVATATGDLLIADIAYDFTATDNMLVTAPTSGNWHLLAHYVGNVGHVVYWRITQTGDDASYTFGLYQAPYSSGGDWSHAVGSMLRFDGRVSTASTITGNNTGKTLTTTAVSVPVSLAVGLFVIHNNETLNWSAPAMTTAASIAHPGNPTPPAGPCLVNGTEAIATAGSVQRSMTTKNTAWSAQLVALVDDTAPVAVGGTLVIAKNHTYTSAEGVNLLTNDRDDDGDAIAVATTGTWSSAEGGSVTVNSDGTFSFTPATDFMGIDTFSYRITDGQLHSEPCAVTFYVGAEPGGLVATDNLYTSATEDVTLVVAGPDGVMRDDFNDTGGTTSVALLSQDPPERGVVDLESDGGFSFQPAVNFNGPFVFHYRLSSVATDAVSDATVTINVAAVNDAPVATPDTYWTIEDTTLTVAASGVLGNDSDADGDTLGATVVDDAGNGAVSMETDGSFTYVPAADWTGIGPSSDAFTYDAHDAHISSSIVTDTVAVYAVNDAPVTTDAVHADLNIDSTNSVTIDLVATDVENDTLTWFIETQPAHGELDITNLQNGSVVYTRDLDYTGPDDSFTYKVTDAGFDQETPGEAKAGATEDRTSQAEGDSVDHPLSSPTTSVQIAYYGTGPTYAAVSDLRASIWNEQVVVSWQAAEADTAGWYLERRQNGESWTAVNSELLPALLGSPNGAMYAVVDKQAAAGRLLIYRLREVELDGGGGLYGPHTLRIRPWQLPPALATQLADGATQAAAPCAVPVDRVAAASPANLLRAPAGAAGNRLRLEIAASGLYTVTAAQIAPAFGLSERAARLLIAANRVVLSCQGTPVATLAVGNGSALYFYAQACQTVTSDRSIYWLAQGIGLPMTSARALFGSGGYVTRFPEIVVGERDVLPATALCDDPAADYWLWDYLVAGSATDAVKSFTLQAPGALTGQSLTLDLQGLTVSGTPDEHHLRVALNGVVVGETRWSGTEPRHERFALPAGLLSPGANTLTLTALKDAGVPYSLIGFDGAEVTYQRAATAVADQILTHSAALQTLRVNGLSRSGALVFDLSSADRPQRVKTSAAGTAGGGAWIAFRAAAGHDYLVAHPNGALAPVARRVVAPSTLRAATRSADYLIITDERLIAAAQRLAAYHAAQGMETAVVTTAEIADEFAFGMPGPQSLHDFLAYAHTSWQRPPRYVLLAGEGSYDYRNLLGGSDCLVAPQMIATPYGLAPSDVALADADGDGVPEVALGRLPVAGVAELDDYLAKLTAYESQATGAWQRQTLFVADDADPAAGLFPADSLLLAGLLSKAGLTSEQLLLKTPPQRLTATQVHDRLLAATGSGRLLVNYVGHGAVNQLAGEKLLSVADAAAFAQSPRLPILSAFTCVAGNYATPLHEGLAEALVGQPAGGAIAMLAPTGLERNEQSMRLAQPFLAQTFGGVPDVRLGETLRSAAAQAAAEGMDATVLQSYALLGDPALRVRW